MFPIKPVIAVGEETGEEVLFAFMPGLVSDKCFPFHLDK